MRISNVNKEGEITNVYFDNGVWVGLYKEEGLWEFQIGDDDDSYLSGGFVLDGGVVIDYDGVFELPEEVEKALRHFYKIDL